MSKGKTVSEGGKLLTCRKDRFRNSRQMNRSFGDKD